MMPKIFLTSVMLCLALFSFSQDTTSQFEGKVTYAVDYEEVPEEYEAYIGMFPKEMTVFVKGKKTCMEQNTMGGGSTTIIDNETNKNFIIMNMMGKKDAYELSPEKKSDKKPTITYLDETKVIAGYTCKKAELKFEGNEDVIVVWYTEEIEGSNPQMQGIKGFPLEYAIEAKGMIMVMTAKAITKETVSDSKFTLPEGMELKPYSELQKLGMGG